MKSEDNMTDMTNKTKLRPGLIACRHYREGSEAYISCEENIPWSGWIIAYDEDGNIIKLEYIPGLYYSYVRHLLTSLRCRREVQITKKKLLVLEERILSMWYERRNEHEL